MSSQRAVSRYGFCLLVLLLLAACTKAAPEFPELTGRVVDKANMLDTQNQTRLTRMLAAHERASSQQIVVATVPDLGGLNIEQYGYQLGRHWGIGDKKDDNGALLIIAKAERKIRIEVGYGLEGKLTDAKSSVIIRRIIRPAFRQGHFAQGIVQGTAAMIEVLGGNPKAAPTAARQGQGQGQHESPSLLRTLMFFGLMVVMIGLFGGGGGGRGRRRGMGGLLALPLLLGGGFGGGRGGGMGGMGGGGFSGGGGGFGGGGASGGW